ncbi:unnamed protein product, partial [Rotaria sp. Silwood2]
DSVARKTINKAVFVIAVSNYICCTSSFLSSSIRLNVRFKSRKLVLYLSKLKLPVLTNKSSF